MPKKYPYAQTKPILLVKIKDNIPIKRHGATLNQNLECRHQFWWQGIVQNVIISVTYCLTLHNGVFVVRVILYQVQMLMFYNVQTTNLTFVKINIRYSVNSYSIAQFQIVSDSKYNIQCSVVISIKLGQEGRRCRKILCLLFCDYGLIRAMLQFIPPSLLVMEA